MATMVAARWCKFSHVGMSSSFVQRGGWWAIGQLLLLLSIAIIGATCHATSKSPAVFVSGLALIAVSVIPGVAGFHAMGRNLTPFPKPSATACFVRRGIYRFIRHPLYTSAFCAALGWSLVWQSWPALFISLATGLFLDAKARCEERWLREQFPEYADYARRVRRFIPWIY